MSFEFIVGLVFVAGFAVFLYNKKKKDSFGPVTPKNPGAVDFASMTKSQLKDWAKEEYDIDVSTSMTKKDMIKYIFANIEQ